MVGANGAGKTTLVTLLARLRDTTGGRILVDGIPITELRPREWQRQVAVVYQDATHFPFSARENVALRTLDSAVDEKALACVAARSDLTKVVDGLPAGWDTVLSTEYEGGTDLSGGQWQRVILARAETGRLTSTAATLDLLERPDYATEIEALTRDRRMLARAIGQVLSLIQVGIQVVAILVLVALIYPLVLLVPLLAIAPAVADRRAARMQKSSDDALAEKRRLQTQLFGLTTGSGPARELRSFDATGAVLDRHARLHAETMRTARSAALWASLGWLVYAAGFVVGIALLVLRAVHGLASPGEVVEVIGLVRRAQRQVSTASDSSTSFATAVRTAGRMRWLARYVQGGPRPQVSAPVPGRLAQGIRLEGIGFTYPLGGKQALRDVTVTLPAGATVALVGDNGAGKTTLVKLLTGRHLPGLPQSPDAGTGGSRCR